MIVNCVWEHNGNDTLLYAVNYIGAYTRGESLEIAKATKDNHGNWADLYFYGLLGDDWRKVK